MVDWWLVDWLVVWLVRGAVKPLEYGMNMLNLDLLKVLNKLNNVMPKANYCIQASIPMCTFTI